MASERYLSRPYRVGGGGDALAEDHGGEEVARVLGGRAV